MIIGINPLSSYGKSVNNRKNNSKQQRNISFQSSPSKLVRNIGIAFSTALVLSGIVSYCNRDKKESPNDIVSYKSKTEKNDSMRSSVGEYRYRDNHVKRVYHYYPSENVSAENYNWSELVYPDGRIEKDSMGYKIFVSPKGERMVIHTKQDEYGHTTITKEFPDGTKNVHIDYRTNMPNETLYVETNYWPNGNMKEHFYYNEYPANNKEQDGERIIEKSHYQYNENEVLIMWETTQIDSARNESNNKYDKKGRLIYDDVKNEKYEYKLGAKHPYRAISELEGCKRIKLLNSNGTVKKEFFKAEDGTITDIKAQ